MLGSTCGESRASTSTMFSLAYIGLAARVACFVVLVVTAYRVLYVIESLQEQAITASEGPMTVASWSSWAPTIVKGLVRSVQVWREAESPPIQPSHTLFDLLTPLPASAHALEDASSSSWSFWAEKLCSIVACETVSMMVRQA